MIAIKSATTEEYLQIVTIARQVAAKMSIKSATTKEYLQMVSNSHTDGSKTGHKVSHY